MKLKYPIIEKLNTLTACEMDLFLYLAKHQEETTAVVHGLYYRDVMKETGMCKQSFYNALKSLEKKNLISILLHSDIDYNIYVVGNAFPEDRSEDKKGYVKLNRRCFRMSNFKSLKAHEKYMFLELCKRSNEATKTKSKSWMPEAETLLEKFRELLGVTGRVIRGYLHNLKQFFSIGIKGGKYYITYKKEVFDTSGEPPAYREALHQRIRAVCHKERIRYNETAIQDTTGLIIQYRENAEATDTMEKQVHENIRKSIRGKNVRERSLNPKYIHMLLRQALGLDKTDSFKELDNSLDEANFMVVEA